MLCCVLCCVDLCYVLHKVNLDEKGYVSGEGAIVVGALFNKEARNSTYAKACFGTFPTLPIPKVFIL
jgi:hypothetical protein